MVNAPTYFKQKLGLCSFPENRVWLPWFPFLFPETLPMRNFTFKVTCEQSRGYRVRPHLEGVLISLYLRIIEWPPFQLVGKGRQCKDQGHATCTKFDFLGRCAFGFLSNWGLKDLNEHAGGVREQK